MAKKILIADDDLAILDALQMILQVDGYEVECTSEGNSILGHDFTPDLYLLDLWMSGVAGEDICRQLKRDPKTKNIPVILVSAHQNVEEIARQAGADGYLIKPFEIAELHNLLKSFL
jgi:DNA-binding response OmpR family regulator